MPVMRASAQLVGRFLIGFLLASCTYAYGPLGHEIVGDIATSQLCAPASAEVRRLLGGETLGRASRWPDWIRNDPKWRHSGPWHYLNVADAARIETATGRRGGDVVWAVRYFGAELADANLAPARRAEALRFVAHFIADVHQPLHVGRAEDRGGNAVTVVIGGRHTNLHRFWDAQWLLKMDRRANGYDTAGQIDALRLLSAGRINELQASNVAAWARESQALRDDVYAFGRDGSRPVELDRPYRETALEITRGRLAAAGVRLAGVLNGIYCPRYSAESDGEKFNKNDKKQ